MVQESERAPVIHECDVLVIGSGTAGYCAAIQAGRAGCMAVLVEKDAVLGGNSGPDLGVGITGAERWNDYGVETGILQEIREDACCADAFTHVTGAQMGYSISRRFEAVVQEHLRRAGVCVLKRHYARRPVMEGSRIAAVVAEDLAAFRTVEIRVRGCVVEASGDGEIGALAGADFDMGSEAREEYGERSAPEGRTARVQGTSLVAIAQRTGREVRFIAPEGDTAVHTTCLAQHDGLLPAPPRRVAGPKQGPDVPLCHGDGRAPGYHPGRRGDLRDAPGAALGRVGSHQEWSTRRGGALLGPAVGQSEGGQARESSAHG